MGTYCELFVADAPVFTEKSQANPLVMTIFRESDKAAEDGTRQDERAVFAGSHSKSTAYDVVRSKPYERSGVRSQGTASAAQVTSAV
jgi:hypothetical protein